MENKDLKVQIKGLSDTGEFTARVAEYNVVDLQNDIILPGSFKRAISQTSAAGIPLLWSHDQATPVGKGTLQDDPKGPIVNGILDRTDPAGELAYNRVLKGLARGVSIGFSLPNSSAVQYTAEGVRQIKELMLHEISLVVVPAQQGATIMTVKQLADAARVLRALPAELDGAMLRELKSLQDAITKRLAREAPGGADAALLADVKALAAHLNGARRPN